MLNMELKYSHDTVMEEWYIAKERSRYVIGDGTSVKEHFLTCVSWLQRERNNKGNIICESFAISYWGVNALQLLQFVENIVIMNAWNQA